jgi:hypothetical protein
MLGVPLLPGHIGGPTQPVGPLSALSSARRNQRQGPRPRQPAVGTSMSRAGEREGTSARRPTPPRVARVSSHSDDQ